MIRGKMEPSKSLDTVDDQTLYNNNADDNNNNNNGTAATSTGSKLPRSLTFTYKKSPNHHNVQQNSNLIQNKSAEPLFDIAGDEEMPLTGKSTENISRSSTGGSLSLVSNLNDVLPANDMSDDESLIDLRTRLTAIDENSLSPLPSLNLMMPTDDNMNIDDNNRQIMDNDNTLTNMENNNDQPERPPSIAQNDPTLINDNSMTNEIDLDKCKNEPSQPIETLTPLQPLTQIVNEEIVDDESVTLSLNSVDINQEPHYQPEIKDRQKLVKKQPNVMNNKRPGQQTNLVTNSTKVTKSGNLRPPITNVNKITKRTNNDEKLNKNACSSRPNSANVSRCTTPALSETDSVCSSTTYNGKYNLNYH